MCFFSKWLSDCRLLLVPLIASSGFHFILQSGVRFYRLLPRLPVAVGVDRKQCKSNGSVSATSRNENITTKHWLGLVTKSVKLPCDTYQVERGTKYNLTALT